MLLPNWWSESRSLLLRNETPGGNWLDVRVEGTQGVNRMGIGSKIKIYPAGKLGGTGCYLPATGNDACSPDPVTRIQFQAKSDCSAEAQRRNGYTPIDGSEATYATQLENDRSIQRGPSPTRGH